MTHKHCDGCDEEQPNVKSYVVTYHDDTTGPANYCEGCAELARMDWNGDTKGLTPAGVR